MLRVHILILKHYQRELFLLKLLFAFIHIPLFKKGFPVLSFSPETSLQGMFSLQAMLIACLCLEDKKSLFVLFTTEDILCVLFSVITCSEWQGLHNTSVILMPHDMLLKNMMNGARMLKWYPVLLGDFYRSSFRLVCGVTVSVTVRSEKGGWWVSLEESSYLCAYKCVISFFPWEIVTADLLYCRRAGEVVALPFIIYFGLFIGEGNVCVCVCNSPLKTIRFMVYIRTIAYCV